MGGCFLGSEKIAFHSIHNFYIIMIKTITILLSFGFLLACNTGIDKDTNTASRPVAESQAEQDSKTPGLSLHNGAKWKADSNTLLNITLLQNIISKAKKETLENYLQTADSLQDGLNKMISECKMTGADHEALHLWLEQLIERINDLKTVESDAIAKTNLDEIENQLNLFSQYFEK